MTEQDYETVWGRRVRWASRRWWNAVTARYAACCVANMEVERIAGLAGYPCTEPVDLWQNMTVDERRWYGWPCSYADWTPQPHTSLIPVECN